KLTGKPTWEVEFNKNPSLQSAYLSAAKHFGIDGWLYNGNLNYRLKSKVEYKSKVITKDKEKWEVLTV
ncbi:hypothetical protein KA005_02240, partial [bacterium]|nr:hypothetical protein [bacterium]